MKKILLVLSCLFLFHSFSFSQNHPPVAVNDTVWATEGYQVLIYPLQNDYDPDGDPIILQGSPSTMINDTTFSMYPHFYGTPDEVNYSVTRQVIYRIKDSHDNLAIARIVFMNKIPVNFDFLNSNNINALISPFGNHFWDQDSSRFEVPKGSGKKALFANSFWIGGINDAGNLCVAAERYRQNGTDFFMGPISNTYDSVYMRKWYRLWKLDKQQIRNHINSYSFPGYVPIDAIANWPAHGDVALGQSADIAPFHDTNLDGVYNPMSGDYPLIRGDEAIYFIMNDLRSINT
jgi:hypothetical protein